MKKFLVAIDQGTTSTRVVLFDIKGNTIDILRDKGSNLYIYKKESLAIILGSIYSILEKNKFNIEDVDAFGVAVAGISDLSQRELLLKELDRINITKKTILLSDVEAAYRILCPNNIENLS